MTSTATSAAIAALVHHVELNKAGWWDRTVQQITLGRLRETVSPVTGDELRGQIEQVIGRRLEAEYFNRVLGELLQSGHIVELPGSGLRLSEGAAVRFEDAVRVVEQNRIAVEATFRAALDASGLSIAPDLVWRAFRESALLPMIADLGARTYELLSGVSGGVETADYLTHFLDGFPEEAHAGLRNVAIQVLDPKNTEVRQFILRELNTRFVLDAAGLQREVLERLGGGTGKRVKTLLFVDTNFLFSLLELHANPANEAAQLLLDLLHHVDDFLDVSLYVLPTTIDEARTRLGVEMDRLRGLVLTKRLAQSVQAGDLSGLAQRYVQEIARGATRISPNEFFGPYHDDLLKFARARGIELYNENMDRWYNQQTVIDDTLDRHDFERKQYKERAKSYEQILHDVALREFAASKRPRRVESPLDAAAWVVTVDYRFLGFDRRKCNLVGNAVPVCVHPAVFTQLLQFWVPRSAEFDAALVASMRLPFFFSSFDSEAERVTVKILGTLGRFENVDQLPEPTITAVLASQALRQRMVAPLSVEESIAAVESAILAENVRAQASAERERLLRKTAERAVAANEVALAEKDRELTRLAEEARVREGALQQLNISMAEAANDKVRMREALHFMFGVLLPVLAGALLLGIGAGIVVSYFAAVPVWQSVAACAVGALLLGMGYIQSRPEWATVTMIWPTLARVPHGWRLIAAGVISLGGYVVLAIFGDPIVSLLRSFMGK